MTIQIITFAERRTEPHGAHIMLLGPPGIDKTSQLKTLNPAKSLFVDGEHGGLGIRDVPAAHIRPETWPQVKDLIVRIAGPSAACGPGEDFSRAHFDRVGGYLETLPLYDTIFFDGINETANGCFHWALQQPEAVSGGGKSDLRGAYGLLARSFLSAMRHLQSARGLNIIMTGTLVTVADDYGRVEHKLQAEGQRIAREISSIVDNVITMASVDFGDGKPIRAFVCTSPNPWNYPAKDRSGKLEQIEPPDLGKLIAKILPPLASHEVVKDGLAEISPLNEEQRA